MAVGIINPSKIFSLAKRGESAANLALFRISIGVISALSLLVEWPRLQVFFGPGAFPSIEQELALHRHMRFSLLFWLPHNALSVELVWGLSLICSITLALGWHTRISAWLLYALLTSLYDRNLEAVNSGDLLLRTYVFLLALTDCGLVFSLDCRKAGCLWAQQWSKLVPAWQIWLMRVQLSAVYFQAAVSKLAGKTWQDGTAVYYATHELYYRKFNLPFLFENPFCVKALTWASLAIELALFTLIWYRPWRKYVLWAGLMLHLGIEWTLNIPFFEYLMVSGYLFFVDSAALRRFLESYQRRPTTTAET